MTRGHRGRSQPPHSEGSRINPAVVMRNPSDASDPRHFAACWHPSNRTLMSGLGA